MCTDLGNLISSICFSVQFSFGNPMIEASNELMKYDNTRITKIVHQSYDRRITQIVPQSHYLWRCFPLAIQDTRWYIQSYKSKQNINAALWNPWDYWVNISFSIKDKVAVVNMLIDVLQTITFDYTSVKLIFYASFR